METDFVFLDTSIYVQECFKFKKNKFSKILELCKNKELNLIINHIVYCEVLNQIEKKIEDEYSKLEKIRYLTDIPNGIRIKNKEYYINKRKIEFDDFLRKANAIYVQVENVGITQIFSDYFSKIGAFSIKDKEFPDAFSVESVRKWAIENKMTAYVISQDEDVKNHCFIRNSEIFSDDKYLLHLESLNDLFKLYNSNNEIFSAVDEFSKLIFEQNKNDIIYKIQRMIEDENILYIVSELESKIYNVNIEIMKFYLISSQGKNYLYEVEYKSLNVIKSKYGTPKCEIGKKILITSKCEVEIEIYKEKINKSKITEIILNDNYLLLFENAIDLSKWPDDSKVIVIGVANGEITDNPQDSQEFKDILEARKIFPDLNPYKSSNRFTAAMGNKHVDYMRFETWKTYEIYSN